jgi:DNA invertase Pin-like site-specific DNA recombinase
METLQLTQVLADLSNLGAAVCIWRLSRLGRRRRVHSSRARQAR